MIKPQITIRVHPDLLSRLEKYVKQTGETKTEVIVHALEEYLECSKVTPLSQIVMNLSARVTNLEEKSVRVN